MPDNPGWSEEGLTHSAYWIIISDRRQFVNLK